MLTSPQSMLCISIWLLFCITQATPIPKSSSKFPNFVFILADDMGWGDTSYNNGTASTPYLDAWRKESNTITFWRGYAAGPVCSPTRASILSGRTPNRECIYSANGCGNEPAWSCSEPHAFPNVTFTIAKAVKKVSNANYQTAFFGKWHLGNFWLKSGHEKDGMSTPSMNGFDYWLATQASAPSVTPNCACFDPVQGCVTGHYAQEDEGPWCTNYVCMLYCMLCFSGNNFILCKF